jgi:polysaccharide biosynthesis/export protein
MAAKNMLPISAITIGPLGLMVMQQVGSQSIGISVPPSEAEPIAQPIAQPAVKSVPIKSIAPSKLAVPIVPPQAIASPKFIKPQSPAQPIKPPVPPIAPPTLSNLDGLPWERIISRTLGGDGMKTRLAQAVSIQSTAQPAVASPAAVATPSAPAAGWTLTGSDLVGNINPSNTALAALDQPIQVAESLPLPISQPSLQRSIDPPPRIAIEQAYVLGAGDRIAINVFNVPEYTGEHQILVDGTVNLPVAGAVKLEGLTLDQASQAITARYGAELSRYSKVTVSLTGSRPIEIAIVGEVGLPGVYTLENQSSQLPSIAQAVQTAGGFTQSADLRQVQVRRATGQATETIEVDLWRLLRDGDLRQNLTLRDGDSIIVPSTTTINPQEAAQLADSTLGETNPQQIKVALVGEVIRPGAYQLESSNVSQLTLTRAIQEAGGITPTADLRKVQIQRTTRNGQPQSIEMNLWELITSGDLSQDLPLQNGDTITFPVATQSTAAEIVQMTATNLSPGEIQVGVIGELKNPGTLTIPSNTSLNQALLRAGGLNSRARRSRADLVRMDTNGTLTRRTIQLDPYAEVNNDTNPLLWNNDLVIVSPSDRTQITDGITNFLEPIMRIFPPLRILF